MSISSSIQTQAALILPRLRSQLPADESSFSITLRKHLDTVEFDLNTGVVTSDVTRAFLDIGVSAWKLVPKITNSVDILQSFTDWNRVEVAYDLILFLQDAVGVDTGKVWVEYIDALIATIGCHCYEIKMECFVAKQRQELVEFEVKPLVLDIQATFSNEQNPDLLTKLESDCNIDMDTAVSTRNQTLYQLTLFKSAVLCVVSNALPQAFELLTQISTQTFSTLPLNSLIQYSLGIVSRLLLPRHPKEATKHYFSTAVSISKDNSWEKLISETQLALISPISDRKTTIDRLINISEAFSSLIFSEIQVLYVNFHICYYFFQNNPKSARKIRFLSLKKHKNIPLTGKILLLNALLEFHGEKMVELCEAAREIIEKCTMTVDIGMLLVRLAMKCRKKDCEMALKLNSQAFIYENQSDIYDHLSLILRKRVKILAEMKEFLTAKTISKAIVEFEDQKMDVFTKNKAILLYFLANIYWKIEGNIEKSEICYIESIFIFKKLSLNRKLSKSYLNLAKMYTKNCDFPVKKVRSLFEKAKEIFEIEYGESHWLFYVNWELSKMYEKYGNWEEMEIHAKRAVKYDRFAGERKEEFRSWRIGALMKAGQKKEAREFAEEKALEEFALERIRPVRKAEKHKWE